MVVEMKLMMEKTKIDIIKRINRFLASALNIFIITFNKNLFKGELLTRIISISICTIILHVFFEIIIVRLLIFLYNLFHHKKL